MAYKKWTEADKEAVRRLHREGVNATQIAARLNMSRTFVRNLLSTDFRSAYERMEIPATADPTTSAAERCGECGALVYMPCVKCEVDARRKRGELIQPPPPPRRDLGGNGIPVYIPSPEVYARELAKLRAEREKKGEPLYGDNVRFGKPHTMEAPARLGRHFSKAT